MPKPKKRVLGAVISIEGLEFVITKESLEDITQNKKNIRVTRLVDQKVGYILRQDLGTAISRGVVDYLDLENK